MASVIDARQEEIAEEFAMFGDWMEKYEHIISLGKELDPLDPMYRTFSKIFATFKIVDPKEAQAMQEEEVNNVLGL